MKYALVTVSDSLVNTSMPYNEFAVYRQAHDPEGLHFYIALFDTFVSTTVPYPEGLKIYRCGKSPRLLRKAVREIREQCAEEGREVLVHLHEGKSVLFFRLVTGRRFRDRTVYTIHSCWNRYALHNKVFSVLASLLARRVVCVSRTSYGEFPSLLKRLLKDRVTWIRNGADCDRVDRFAGGRTPSPDGRLRIVCVARLIPSKKQALLLHAVKECPGCTLTLIGGGTDRKALETMAGELGIADRVCFTGSLSRNEVFARLREHDLFVSASEYEGLPISLMEAMRAGLPCAVSDIPSHREIREQCPALVTVENTGEGWTRAIREWARKTPAEREKAGNANREDIKRFFSLEEMHRQYDKVYAGILGKEG